MIDYMLRPGLPCYGPEAKTREWLSFAADCRSPEPVERSVEAVLRVGAADSSHIGKSGHCTQPEAYFADHR